MSAFIDFFKKIFSAKSYFKSLSLYSDIDILHQVNQKGLITTRVLAQKLNISWLDASHRLSTLHMQGALKYLSDSMGVVSYTLLEDIDDFSFIHSLYEGTIDIDCILRLSEECNGQAQPIHLAIMADISIKEAKKHFKKFKKQGILSTVYTNHWKRRYISPNSMTSKKNYLASPKNQQRRVLKARVVMQDAEIIKLAIEAQGKLSATALCLKKEIDLNLAQKTLDDLQERHVFDIHVNENGTIEYWLNDKSLLN